MLMVKSGLYRPRRLISLRRAADGIDGIRVERVSVRLPHAGLILMTKLLLDANPAPRDDEIRHCLSGNLRPRGAYPQIMDAVKLAAQLRS
jgi:hypothetical protein